MLLPRPQPRLWLCGQESSPKPWQRCQSRRRWHELPRCCSPEPALPTSWPCTVCQRSCFRCCPCPLNGPGARVQRPWTRRRLKRCCQRCSGCSASARRCPSPQPKARSRGWTAWFGLWSWPWKGAMGSGRSSWSHCSPCATWSVLSCRPRPPMTPSILSGATALSVGASQNALQSALPPQFLEVWPTRNGVQPKCRVSTLVPGCLYIRFVTKAMEKSRCCCCI
mmetsp:Transcript_46531/g.83921  ORF Transcript_46531/g.83921 Transcript_46531/m.83921 type:complete len:223 (+) Transcript_46531:2008-2676(+)